ncbi:hypothetical protein HDU83_004933 [Entophlyctis luteolus]|nr:hypothetical protein HDU82_000162 [Entophlyctis luteolus]KAJ3344700.1 hypothetical protein HDU83_004933 [Entophlyctis luteolus]KAJ3382476.1 hypothetical protein HDU84_004260 [Entophlyctis sp. JEL0112]
MFIDVVGYSVSVVAVEMGSRPATSGTPYLYLNCVQLLGALVSLFLTWNLVVGLIAEAFNRIDEPHEVNAKAMLFSALFGVAANSFMALMLQPPPVGQDEHFHDHVHNSGDTKTTFASGKSCENTYFALMPESRLESFSELDVEAAAPNTTVPHCLKNFLEKNPATENSENINVQAAMVHIIGDLLGSISIVIASCVLLFKPEWTIIDPICTIVFAAIIFLSTLGLARQYVMIMMERVPENTSVEIITSSLLNHEAVQAVDAVRLWSLIPGKNCCVVRVRVATAWVESRKSHIPGKYSGGDCGEGFEMAQLYEDATVIEEGSEEEGAGDRGVAEELRHHLQRVCGAHLEEVYVEVLLVA